MGDEQVTTRGGIQAVAGRLRHLDGVRGVAVAAVVAFHLYQRIADPARSGLMPAGWPSLAWVGRVGVDAFIVLSGYSLMLPVARSGDGRLVGGARRYARRRAWRVLPSYYAALLACLLPLLPGFLGWKVPWRATVSPRPNLSVGSIVAHVFLVHNLRPDWATQINGVMWSLPTECQIYILFPLVLLPMWRTVGGWATAAVAFGGGAAVGWWTPALMTASPWYAGLFAVGMVAAVATVRGSAVNVVPLGGLALLAAWAIWACAPWAVPAFDGLIGIAVASLLVEAGRSSRWALPFAYGGVVRLGVVSYSVYLIHLPLMDVADSMLAVAHIRGLARVVVLPSVAVGVLAVGTAAFHRLFERPFMPGHPTTERQAVISAALEPAA